MVSRGHVEEIHFFTVDSFEGLLGCHLVTSNVRIICNELWSGNRETTYHEVAETCHFEIPFLFCYMRFSGPGIHKSQLCKTLGKSHPRPLHQDIFPRRLFSTFRTYFPTNNRRIRTVAQVSAATLLACAKTFESCHAACSRRRTGIQKLRSRTERSELADTF